MTYDEALLLTYTGAMITRSSFGDQVYIIRDLSIGGNNPTLYYNDDTETKSYDPTTDDESATDWVEFTFPWN